MVELLGHAAVAPAAGKKSAGLAASCGRHGGALNNERLDAPLHGGARTRRKGGVAEAGNRSCNWNAGQKIVALTWEATRTDVALALRVSSELMAACLCEEVGSGSSDDARAADDNIRLPNP